MKKVSRTNDLAFKKAFASDGNTESIIGLARDILGIDIKEVLFRQPYSIESYTKMIKEKQFAAFQQTIKDISANVVLNNKGVNLISELQVREAKRFLERSLYYPTQTFSENYKDNKYSSLKPIYAINIVGYLMFKQDLDGLRIFEMWDKLHNEGFPIEFKIAYFEYKKTNFNTDIQFWRDYFLDKEISDNAPEYIKHAAEIVEYANLEEEEKELVDLIERFEADQRAREEWVRDDATRKERILATKKERILSIKNMMDFDIPIEKIAAKYNITVEQVKELLKDVDSVEKH